MSGSVGRQSLGRLRSGHLSFVRLTLVRLGLGCLVTVGLLGCGGGGSGAPVDPAAYDEGRQLFGEFCASCHGTDGSGQVGPALSDGRVADEVGGVDDVAAIIKRGKGRMPGLEARLTEDQITAIAEYVHDLL